MLLSLRQEAAPLRKTPRGLRALLATLPASLAMVLRVRIGLTISDLNALRQRLLPAVAPGRYDLVEAARIAWGVIAASRIVPFASCLTQAQSCQALLAAKGIASELCLGVREDASGTLRAHAWLLCGDRLLLGGEAEDLGRFQLLTQMGPKR